MKKFMDEFKAFAVKGNALMVAVGVVIGAAFTTVVNSLVGDIILPAIAMVFGKPDFSAFVIGSIKIGSFITAVVNFLIIAVSVFVVIKMLSGVTRTDMLPKD